MLPNAKNPGDWVIVLFLYRDLMALQGSPHGTSHPRKMIYEGSSHRLWLNLISNKALWVLAFSG